MKSEVAAAPRAVFWLGFEPIVIVPRSLIDVPFSGRGVSREGV